MGILAATLFKGNKLSAYLISSEGQYTAKIDQIGTWFFCFQVSRICSDLALNETFSCLALTVAWLVTDQWSHTRHFVWFEWFQYSYISSFNKLISLNSEEGNSVNYSNHRKLHGKLSLSLDIFKLNSFFIPWIIVNFQIWKKW